MRRWIVLSHRRGRARAGGRPAQDAEALRKELEQMRKQFESMKEGYEKSINSLSERLQKLEQAPAPARRRARAGRARGGQAAPARPAAACLRGHAVALDLARPRQPFALYERRGPGQLLFDMGVAGDFVGNLTQRNVQQGQRRHVLRAGEPLLPARDRAVASSARSIPTRAPRSASRRARSARPEISVSLAEAHLTLLTLPFDTQLKMGQMRNRFGLLNQIHEHDRPFIDRPNVLRAVLRRGGPGRAGRRG